MTRARSICAAAGAVLLLGACAATPPASLEAALRSQPVVLLGEVHDNAVQHAERARALATLVAGGARPALVMEAFDGDRQAALDRAAAAPGASADSVIAAAGGAGWSWPLYRPYIALALEHRLPLVAGNVSRADARRVVAEGLQASGFDPAVPEDILAAQAQAIVDGHCGQLGLADARRLAPAQVARDQFMARGLEAHAARGAVLLAGNGHVRRDIGVPRWLSPAVRERSVSIGYVESSGGDPAEPPADYDLRFASPAEPREDPCAKLQMRPSSNPSGS